MRKNSILIIIILFVLVACDNPTSVNSDINKPDDSQLNKKELVNKNRVIFSSDRDSSLGTNLFMMDLYGDNIKQLTNFSGIGLTIPTDISSDGKKILFYRLERVYGGFSPDIYILNLLDLSVNGPYVSGFAGEFLYDDNSFVYSSKVFMPRESFFYQTRIYDLNKNESVDLTPYYSNRASASFSPDWESFVCINSFDTDEIGTSQLLLYSKDGKLIKELTEFKDQMYIYAPKFLNDGENVVFVSNLDGSTFKLCKINIHTKEIKVLTKYNNTVPFGIQDYFNCYPSNSGNIYFNSRNKNGEFPYSSEIFEYDKYKERAYRLTNDQYQDTNPIAGKIWFYE